VEKVSFDTLVTTYIRGVFVIQNVTIKVTLCRKRSGNVHIKWTMWHVEGNSWGLRSLYYRNIYLYRMRTTTTTTIDNSWYLCSVKTRHCSLNRSWPLTLMGEPSMRTTEWREQEEEEGDNYVFPTSSPLPSLPINPFQQTCGKWLAPRLQFKPFRGQKRLRWLNSQMMADHWCDYCRTDKINLDINLINFLFCVIFFGSFISSVSI
jgi:hypothetical protein